MKTKLITWSLLITLAALGLAIWIRLSFPQLAFLDLKVDRSQALTIAKNYLSAQDIDHDKYLHATVFSFQSATNRYLQKTIGFAKLKEFIRDHDYDMFFWLVRFFKEGQKEEFRLTISASTGQVTGFQHIIDDNEARDKIEKEEAKVRVIAFLKENFNFDPDLYEVKGDSQEPLDNRTDYSFSWNKKDVKIPWSDEKDSGTGKLGIGATISGNEILSFTKNYFIIPDQFNRFLDKKRIVGNNLITIISIFYYAFIVAAVYFVVKRRNHLAMHTTKKFYIGIVSFIFLLIVLGNFNQFESLLFDFSTTDNLQSYLSRLLINTIVGGIFISIVLIMPCLAGELLHHETTPDRKKTSFLYYLHSSFLTRSVAESIIIGYLVCLMMLGLQSLLINFGQRYLGVWTEQGWMTYYSTTNWPFLAAFTIGFRASINEEILFRLFGISLGQKIFKNTAIAILLSSIVWGFGHSNYPVYPMWFRGLEVSCLGIFLSLIYLRFGLIPTLVGHYLFDVFWQTAEHLLGHSKPIYFISTIIVLSLPMFIALIAIIVNRSNEMRPLRWSLSKHSLFNLDVLKTYITSHSQEFSLKSAPEIKQEFCGHGWDPAVVDTALEDLGRKQKA